MQMQTLEHYAQIVESVTGHSPLAESRARPIVEARIVLASLLLDRGMTECEAGRAIGWDHSTIHHYREIMRDAKQYGTRPQMVASYRQIKSILDL